MTHHVATRHLVAVGEVLRRAIQAAAVGGADEVPLRGLADPANVNDFAKQEVGRPGGPDADIVPAGLKPNQRRGALS